MNEAELKKTFGILISRNELDENLLPLAEIFYERGLKVLKNDVIVLINQLGFKNQDTKIETFSKIRF